MKHYHPRTNDKGQHVELFHPSQPTGQAQWMNPLQRATVIPDGPMPAAINGISFQPWNDAPTSVSGWESLCHSFAFEEPPLKVKPGKKPASGVVIIETDGRIWVVSPSNQFGGYANTFPKGTIFPGDTISLRANALKEAYEEAGLLVELTGFLVDSERTTTNARYYLGRRLGGNPAAMGWESQAVNLVPRDQLAKFASHHSDKVVVEALDKQLPFIN